MHARPTGLTASHSFIRLNLPTYLPTNLPTYLPPWQVLEACQASCDRLGVESVDLYYVHRLHPTVPVEEQARAMQVRLGG